jgi:protein TonB
MSKKGVQTIKKSGTSDTGTKNRYFAHIEQLLKGWPAQVNFAGEEIDVWLKVYNSGTFEFKIKKLSNNSEFNDALIAYLKQLQSIGFGPHNNDRPYEIEVSFIAHE